MLEPKRKTFRVVFGHARGGFVTAEMAMKRKAINETVGRDLSEEEPILCEIQGFVNFADC